MSELIWINGKTIPMAEATSAIEDRGFQFADGVYEVFRIYDGRPFAMARHLERLENSAGGIQIKLPLPAAALDGQIRNFVGSSGLRDGYVYLQLTRGVAPRNHKFPANIRPTLLFYARPLPAPPVPGEGEGVKLLAVDDDRWKRCWIKSIALLPNILAKNEAIAQGYDEAVFVNGDVVTECCTSNLFAVVGGKLITHPVGSKVLPGITRAVILDLAEKLGITCEERPLREEEARRADELFISSTTRELGWVARWNDRYIGKGKCGAVTKKLHIAFQEAVRQDAQASKAAV